MHNAIKEWCIAKLLLVLQKIANDKQPQQNNSKETTAFEQERKEFCTEYFAYFKNNAAWIKSSSFINVNRENDDMKDYVGALSLLENPTPKVPTK